MSNSDTKLTPTNILNRSFDATYDVLTTEQLEYDPAGAMKRKVTGDLGVQIDTSGGTTIYIGKAAIGSAASSAVWQIKKLDTTSGLAVTWAGSGNFNQVWNNRAALSYA